MTQYSLPAEAPRASVVRLKQVDAKRRTTVLLTDEPDEILGDVVIRQGFRVKVLPNGDVSPTAKPTMWILDPEDLVEIVAEEIYGGPI